MYAAACCANCKRKMGENSRFTVNMFHPCAQKTPAGSQKNPMIECPVTDIYSGPAGKIMFVRGSSQSSQRAPTMKIGWFQGAAQEIGKADNNVSCVHTQ
jgi:hypothetical protein